MLLTAVVTTALLAGCGAVASGVTEEAGPPVATSTVQVVDNDFDPPDAELVAGGTMTWRWEGDSDHNVVGDEFESPVQRDGTFEHRFPEPGTYDYRCTLHGGMQGTVTVVASDGAGS
jgi:plastocyanin